MSQPGTNPLSGLTNVWGELVTWGEGTLTAVEKFLGGLAATVTADQFTIIGKVATVYKAAITAGQSQSAAFTAALNELSADEQGELTSIELSLLNFIVQISGTAPTLTP